LEKKGKDVKITPELNIILKNPLGLFFQGTIEETIQKVKKYFSENENKINPPLIITVGDICTRSLHNSGINIDIAIIDGKTLRTSQEDVNFPAKKIYKLSNKKGYIEGKAWNIIIDAINSVDKPVIIEVDGEEDLLTLIAVLESPLNSIVFYGQPPIKEFNMEQGLVLINVTPEKKKEFIGYLEKMELVE